MFVTTIAIANRTNVYTSTFRSEYFSDVLQAVTEMEGDYTNRKHIEAIDTLIDMDAADCCYYQMTVTYYTTCEKTKAFAARLVEIAAENAAWVAEQAAKATVATAGAEVAQEAAPEAKKPIVVNGVTIANPEFKADGMKSNVGKFVKWMWNHEDEDSMWFWVRENRTKFPEYAQALVSILGEEAEQLRWQWEGMQDPD
jgi:hypothetical protein